MDRIAVLSKDHTSDASNKRINVSAGGPLAAEEIALLRHLYSCLAACSLPKTLQNMSSGYNDFQ
jgi:hypothetical protein